MVPLLAVMLIVSLSLNKVEANSWETIEEGSQESPEVDVKGLASIQMKTDSPLNSKERFNVIFFDDEGNNRELHIQFQDSLRFYIQACTVGYEDFTNVPSDDEKLWTIAYTGPNEEGPRLTVHINDVEVMNFLVSTDTCGAAYQAWTPIEVTRIQLESYFTAINGYRIPSQEDEDTSNEEGGDTGNEEGGDMGHYSHAFNCKASEIVLASFLCVLNLII